MTPLNSNPVPRRHFPGRRHRCRHARRRMVILVDEEDRENEGDLVLAADHVTPEAINFMAVSAAA
jgi:3,4-dihydroxy-2-butanone 4-phosphate synthase